MNTQKLNKFALSLAIALLAMLATIAIIASPTQTAYAQDTSSSIQNFDEYTDSDNFVYDNSTYSIQMYESNETLKHGNVTYDSNLNMIVSQDNAITRIVPKMLFQTVGDYLHIGKEYGFFIHTENISNSHNKLSTVLIFDIITSNTDLEQNGGVVEVSVEPIIQRQYCCLSPLADRYYFRKLSGSPIRAFANVSVAQDTVIPHADCHGYTKNIYDFAHDFLYDYDCNDYYLKDISYEMTLFNEQSSNYGMPDYNANTDTGSYFTYFDYKYQGTVRQNDQIDAETKWDFAKTVINIGLSIGKATLKSVPVIGTILSIGDNLMKVVDLVEGGRSIYSYAVARDNYINPHDVDVNNGKITATQFYSNRDDQLAHYGNLVKSVSTIIRTDDNQSIWYKKGNKATGYFKIAHSALNGQPKDYTRLVKQIALSVVKADGTLVDTNVGTYSHMLREPVYKNLPISHTETVRLLDNGTNYFSFTPQYTSDYKLSIDGSAPSTLYLNNVAVEPISAGGNTYSLRLVGGNAYNLKLVADNYGYFGSINIDANSDLINLQVNGNYVVKLTSDTPEMYGIDTQNSNVLINRIFKINGNGEYVVDDAFSSYTAEKSVDAMINSASYIVLSSSTPQTVSLGYNVIPSLSSNGTQSLNLTGNGSYRYVQLDLINDHSYMITANEFGTQTAPSCSLYTRAYNSQGQTYNNFYNYISSAYRFDSTGTKFYFGFKASQDITIQVKIQEAANAFKWEVFKIENNKETLVQNKSVNNTFNVETDLTQNLNYRFVMWINDLYTAPSYNLLPGSNDGITFSYDGIMTISTACIPGSTVNVSATSLNDYDTAYKKVMSVNIRYALYFNPTINYNNAFEISWNNISTHIIPKEFYIAFPTTIDTKNILCSVPDNTTSYNFYTLLYNNKANNTAIVTLKKIKLKLIGDSYVELNLNDSENSEQNICNKYVAKKTPLTVNLNCMYSRTYQKSSAYSTEYFVANALQLYNIRHDQSYDRTLENDIDLQSIEWTPIDELNCRIYGKGHTISNLKFTTYADGRNYGFVRINNASIGAVTFKNVSIVSAQNSNATNWTNIGAVAGVNNGTLSMVIVTGTIDVYQDFGIVGGLVGTNSTNATIGWSMFGSLSEPLSTMVTAGDSGGIAGNNFGSIVLCYTRNAYIANYIMNNARSLGGIVGYGNQCEIRNCSVQNLTMDNQNPSTVKKSPKMGLIVGHLQNSTIANVSGKDYEYYYGNIYTKNRQYCYKGDWPYYGLLENCTFS